MSRRKAFVEGGKTLLIILLVISAAILVRASGYFDAFDSRYAQDSETQSGQNGQSTADSASGTMSARPLGMVVSGVDGTRYAVAYDSAETASVFESFSAALGEALGSASNAEEVTEDQWRECLLSGSVTFDFYYPRPLSLLSMWLGTAAGGAGSFSARFVSLSCEGDAVSLYFRSEPDGTFYRCGTGVSTSAVSAKLDSYKRNNASFAFENDKFSGVAPYTVVLDELPAVHTVNCDSALGSLDLEGLMSALGMNSYVIRPYTESDGTQVYVENGKNLKINGDGSISFKTSLTYTTGQDAISAVSVASELVTQVLGSCCGDAETYFSGVRSSGSGVYEVEFEYIVGGIPVELSSGRAAAQVTVSGGEVMKLELTPRRYTLMEDEALLLPMTQAAAIAASKGGGEPVLVYMDSGAWTPCVWVTD